MRRCRLVGWFCYRTSDRVPVRTGGKVNSQKRSRDGAIFAGDGEVGTNNRKMFQGKVKTEWLTKGALSPTFAIYDKMEN
jgi:hypothetical protein